MVSSKDKSVFKRKEANLPEIELEMYRNWHIEFRPEPEFTKIAQKNPAGTGFFK